MDEQEFVDYAQENPEELAEFVYEQNQSEHPAKTMLKEMAGPAGGAVGAAASAGLATLGPAGAVVVGGATAYMLKQSIDGGPTQGFANAKTAVTESYQATREAAAEKVTQFRKTHHSGSGESDGSTSDRKNH